MNWFHKDEIKRHYNIEDTIGAGNFAEVKRCSHRATGRSYAVKVIEKRRVDPKRRDKILESECDALRRVKHPNIVQLHEIFDTTEKLYIVMEYVSGGEMLEQIVNKGSYSERDASALVRQITETVDYLHSQGIVHRDLNPGNILLDGDADNVERCQIKIADFGLASFFEHEAQQMYTCCGTPEYVAPEVLEGKGYSYQCDVWSIGIILYIMLCGYPPFYDDSIAGQFKLICAGNIEFQDSEWRDISVEAKDLVSHMLVVKPELRFGTRECLSHPWLMPRAWSAASSSASSASSGASHQEERRATPAAAARGEGGAQRPAVDPQQAAWGQSVQQKMSTFLDSQRGPPLMGARPRPRRRIAASFKPATEGGRDGRGTMLTLPTQGGAAERGPGARALPQGPYRVPEPEPAPAPGPHYGGGMPGGGGGRQQHRGARPRAGGSGARPPPTGNRHPTLARQPAAHAARNTAPTDGPAADDPRGSRPYRRPRGGPPQAAATTEPPPGSAGSSAGTSAISTGSSARHTPGASMFRQHPATQLPPPPAEGSRRPVPRHRHTPGPGAPR